MSEVVIGQRYGDLLVLARVEIYPTEDYAAEAHEAADDAIRKDSSEDVA